MVPSATSSHSFHNHNLLVILLAAQCTQAALDIPWSTTKYGPDGPWQAVRIKVGGYDPALKIDAQNHADIDAYPGGIYESFTFGSPACSSFSNGGCGKGGVWDRDPDAMSWFAGFDGAWHPTLQDKTISSYSYGLHIGSAAFEYSGSLVFGGYNKGRVIGPITSMFKDDDKINLLDINIGVEHGESPFDFDSKKNLLIGDTGTVGASQEVKIDPKTPYLSLPDNTCEGLANVLPIKLDQTTKLYHWQTDDPRYKKIVTSPAYMASCFHRVEVRLLMSQ
jgi:hypothetical protein